MDANVPATLQHLIQAHPCPGLGGERKKYQMLEWTIFTSVQKATNTSLSWGDRLSDKQDAQSMRNLIAKGSNEGQDEGSLKVK